MNCFERLGLTAQTMSTRHPGQTPITTSSAQLARPQHIIKMPWDVSAAPASGDRLRAHGGVGEVPPKICCAPTPQSVLGGAAPCPAVGQVAGGQRAPSVFSFNVNGH